MSEIDKPLTVDDPIEPAILEELKLIHETRQQLADNMLSLEQEKVQILAAARKLDVQRDRIFESCNVARGLSPLTKIDVDAKTGRITVTAPLPS